MIKIFSEHIEIDTAGGQSLKDCFDDFAADVRALGDDVLLITDSDNVLEFQNKDEDSILVVHDAVHHCMIVNVYLSDDRCIKPIYIYNCYEFLEAKQFVNDILSGDYIEEEWIHE